MNTHGLIVDFGKHKGQLWTRIPADYLRWLVNQPDDLPQFSKHKEIAKAELARRGTNVSNQVELSPHAIDNASLRVRKVWHETSKEGEGLYTWLSRVATEAIEGRTDKPDKIIYKNICFVLKWGEFYPILKTVIYKKDKHQK